MQQVSGYSPAWLTGGVTKGNPVVLGASGDANKVIAKTGGTDTVPVFGVAMGTVSAGGEVEVLLATPQVLFIIPVQSTDTPVIGASYGLSTTFEIDDDNVTQTMVKVVDLVYTGKGVLDTTKKLCVVLNWA